MGSRFMFRRAADSRVDSQMDDDDEFGTSLPHRSGKVRMEQSQRDGLAGSGGTGPGMVRGP